jgi:protein CpxP
VFIPTARSEFLPSAAAVFAIFKEHQMKRILLPAALVLALSGGLVFAQQAAHKQKQHDPHKVALKMAKELNLTPDQTTKIEPVIAAREQKVSALKADSSLTPDARKQQVHAIHQDTESQLNGILTPDQMTKLKALHKNKKEKEKKTA